METTIFLAIHNARKINKPCYFVDERSPWSAKSCMDSKHFQKHKWYMCQCPTIECSTTYFYPYPKGWTCFSSVYFFAFLFPYEQLLAAITDAVMHVRLMTFFQISNSHLLPSLCGALHAYPQGILSSRKLFCYFIFSSCQVSPKYSLQVSYAIPRL